MRDDAHSHLLVASGEERFPVKIITETPNAFLTPHGIFDKATRRKVGDPAICFVRPFSASERRP